MSCMWRPCVIVNTVHLGMFVSICVSFWPWTWPAPVCLVTKSICITTSDSLKPTSVKRKDFNSKGVKRELGTDRKTESWLTNKPIMKLKAKNAKKNYTYDAKPNNGLSIFVCLVLALISYQCSWVWSCSIVPGHWELLSIQWHLIPPAHNLGCTQTAPLHQQQSCCPCADHFLARGLNCTGWHWSLAPLLSEKQKVCMGFSEVC